MFGEKKEKQAAHSADQKLWILIFLAIFHSFSLFFLSITLYSSNDLN